MPRDTAGNYTLPLGNPVIDGTIIETTWANPTMEDIAVQLNNVYTRDGKLGPLAPFFVLDGTMALPGLAFVNSPSTGLWYGGASAGYSYGGSAVWTAALNQLTFNVPPLYAADPATDNALTRKSYVDTKFVPLTGATLSGPLTLNYASPTFNFDALASGQTAGVNYLTAGALRWAVLKSNTAESGSNLGSNFNIVRYTDAGVASLAVYIARDSGQVSLYGDVVVQPPATPGARTMYVSGISGSSAAYALRDGGVVRWQLVKAADNTFGIYRYDAAGAAVDVPMSISPITGATTFNVPSFTVSTVGELSHVLNSNSTSTLVVTNYKRGGLMRWEHGMGAAPESAPANGSNFILECYDNSGAKSHTIYVVSRATGVMDFVLTPTVGGRPIIVATPEPAPAVATDLASAITLINTLRAKLQALGVYT